MGRLCRKSVLIGSLACGGILFILSGVQAEEDSSISIQDTNFQTAEEVQAYWSSERMQQAIPMPLPEIVMSTDGDLSTTISQEKSLQTVGEPGYSLSWSPQSGLPKTDPTVIHTISQNDPSYAQYNYGSDFLAYATAPTNPDTGPYSPFQRWTHYQNYTKQATATIGKLFFTDGTYNYVCSASVIGEKTIATAAHCLHSGGPTGGFYQGWLFCPSYYKGSGSGAPYPTLGCWSWTQGKVSSAWVNTSGGAMDRDYACLVTAETGDTVPDRVGNVTGWTGRAMNLSSDQPMVSWGYPAGSPFRGYHIVLSTSPEWYEVDMTPGDGQVSKYMGNDMTGGSSGGPWWLSVSHWMAGTEVDDTDGYGTTDPPGSSGLPGGPYINGVNSHRRCSGSCFTPPTSTSGTFWQEMGSAQFRGTAGDTDESEDIFAYCFGYE